jgi:hypothetical protein
MIDKFVFRVRAALLSLAVAAALSLTGLASPVVAQSAITATEPSTHAFASDSASDVVLAQQAKKRPKAEKTADTDEETAGVQKALKETAEWVKTLPGIGTFVSVLPQLWTPLRAAALLVFLAFFVLFHFRRQQRNLLEAEQNRQPSAAEAEFGIVVDSEGKEV